MMPFQIRFKRRVVFKDCLGTILKVYHEGDTLIATYDTGCYFVTNMGGIWHDEAEKV